MSVCPNTTEGGCRCPEHHPGLGAYAADPLAYDAAIARLRARGVRFSVVTLPPDSFGCNRGMTCTCERCSRERAALPGRVRDKPQPWDPKPMRHAA